MINLSCLLLTVLPIVAKGPRVEVVNPVVELGEIMEGEIVDVFFEVRNIGDKELLIGRIETDCGCTAAELAREDRVVLPGQSVKLKITFDTARRAGPNEQTKTTRFFTNDDSNKEVEVTFKALVKSLYRLDPEIQLRSIARGATSRHESTIFRGSVDQPVEIVALHAQGPIEVNAVPSSQAREAWRLQYTVAPTAAMGPFQSNITLILKVGDMEMDETIQATGYVQSDLLVRPKMVNGIGLRARPGHKLAPIEIYSASRQPFAIQRVVAPPWLDAAFQEKATGAILIELIVKASAQSGPVAGTVAIHTDSLDQPIIKVPVYVHLAPAVQIEPPLLRFRLDGTDAGRARVLTVTASQMEPPLRVEDIVCPEGVEAIIIPESKPGLEMFLLEISKASPLAVDPVVVIRTSLGSDIRVPVEIIRGDTP